MLSEIFNPLKYLALTHSDSSVSERMDVVTSLDEIAALSAKMDRDLDAHVTIIWKDEKGQLDRDDLYGFSGEMRPTCKLHRYYSMLDDNVPSCHYCDDYHYELLKSGVYGTPFEQHRPDCFVPAYQTPEIKTDPVTKISYIEYHCPIMGYLELLISIVIDGVFLGAVFIGQILRNNDGEAQRIFDDYFSSKSGYSQERIKKLREIRAAECGNPEADDDGIVACLTSRFKLLGDNAYDELCRKCFQSVNNLMSELKSRVIEKRKKAIRNPELIRY